MGNDANDEHARGERPGREGDEGSRPESEIEERHALTEGEEEKVLARLKLRAPAVYATVKEEGEAELGRPTRSLFFSAIVAGVAMGFSILTLALIRDALPDADWAPLLSSFGYAAGFLIVILGRQQLFTENTITAVLPLTAHLSSENLANLCRLWGTVLAGNWIGCVAIAAAFTLVPLVPQDVSAAVVDASRHYGGLGAIHAFTFGIGGGFIVAALVWMMPGTEGDEFLLITFAAWLIALGGFTHVIAGMVEVAALVMVGELGALDGLFRLTLPTLAGNVIGGTALFAFFAYAQVKEEVHG